MVNKEINIPSVSVKYAATGKSKKSNELGMREMQERAYEKRGEQYLLIKSPPASGKSRALMFIAIDKTTNQSIQQAIIVVPEKSIGKSFDSTPLSDFGFWSDWEVKPKWNLCNSPGEDGGTVNSIKVFLDSGDTNLVCTHATFRFAVAKFGIEVFDNRLIAIDEFHHVSANPDNVLGNQLAELLVRDKVHILAMTGSYFRGDADAVMSPDDEAKFQTVTYTYYEQLNGYEYLKELNIGYYFYNGPYVDDILKVLDPNQKTILHIPNVNSRESTKDKIKEVEHILEELGDWQGTDPDTGFYLIDLPDGRRLKVADLVDDDPTKRSKVQTALRSPEMESDRDYIDIIIALGMAKEGFDWIWCEHALTVGYRASLTEIVQIIGRATRDAPGKERTRFTNLIAEPDASQEDVADAVNVTLKAIAASLLMEQVLTPRYDFTPKTATSGPLDGFNYGDGGYDPTKQNVGVNNETGQIQIEITGLVEPKSVEAQRICKEDISELITAFTQDKRTIERGIFDEELVPEEITQVAMGKIVAAKYPHLEDDDKEAVRQHAIAAINMTQQVKKTINEQGNLAGTDDDEDEPRANRAFVDGVKQFVIDVTSLDVDFIDHINPFGEAYSILAKSMSEENLRKFGNIIAGKRAKLTLEESRELAVRASKFKKERGRLPEITSNDPWEKRIAEGMYAFVQMKAEADQNG
ncbi:MAG: DEAD/DEAH box helicase [Pseudomonadales bacterium]|nr:DEAD/DEAH box helicase [Pseudomonadales bacterium]